MELCDAKLTLLLIARHISLLENAGKRVDFAFLVSLAVGDYYDLIKKISTSVKTMRNLMCDLLKAGCMGAQPER